MFKKLKKIARNIVAAVPVVVEFLDKALPRYAKTALTIAGVVVALYTQYGAALIPVVI